MTKYGVYCKRWKIKYPRKSKLYEKQFKFRKRLFFWDLKTNSCSDCNKRFHPVAMDFDHRPRTKKLSKQGFICTGKNRILKEIIKCDLVCSNCHRIRFWVRANQNKHVIKLFNAYRVSP